jgi:hypothetical protein
MKTLVKIIISCLIIIGLTIYATKKSIDYSFEKMECSQNDISASMDFSIPTEEV